MVKAATVRGAHGLVEHLAVLVFIEPLQRPCSGPVLPDTDLHDGPETEGDVQLDGNPRPLAREAIYVDGSGRAGGKGFSVY